MPGPHWADGKVDAIAATLCAEGKCRGVPHGDCEGSDGRSVKRDHELKESISPSALFEMAESFSERDPAFGSTRVRDAYSIPRTAHFET